MNRQYRVTITPADGTIPPQDYPRYVYVDAVNASDAKSEARAYLRVKGIAPRYFDLKVNRSDVKEDGNE